MHVYSSQGHPWARNHLRISSCLPSAAIMHILSLSQSHHFARAHFRTFRCPPYAAPSHIPRTLWSFQGHPWARAHWRTSRYPFLAAIAHVLQPQGHPLARAHWRIARCPFLAAISHVIPSQGHPWARAHWRTSRCPFSAFVGCYAAGIEAFAELQTEPAAGRFWRGRGGARGFPFGQPRSRHAGTARGRLKNQQPLRDGSRRLEYALRRHARGPLAISAGRLRLRLMPRLLLNARHPHSRLRRKQEKCHARTRGQGRRR